MASILPMLSGRLVAVLTSSLVLLAMASVPVRAGYARPGGSGTGVAAASPLPGVGSTIESCASGGRLPTPRILGQFTVRVSGPVNLVLLSARHETPHQDMLDGG